MEKQKPLEFNFHAGRASGLLKAGVTLDGVLHQTFVLREATVDDILDAENEADVMKPLNFAAQLLLRQLVSIGSFEGPFTLNMIRRMKPADWRVLRAAQTELDALGEDASPGGGTS
jgi:phage FluMu protein gp41